MILALGLALASRGLRGLLAKPVERLIGDRIRRINQAFDRLAARVAAGTYRPRKSFTRRPPESPTPRQQSPVPQGYGWVKALGPEMNPFTGWLEMLLREPEMAAVIQAAPAEAGRILRPLCWMLRLKPPPALAAPKRPRKAAPEPAPGSAAEPPRPRPPRPGRVKSPARADATGGGAPQAVPDPPRQLPPPAANPEPIYDYHWLGPSYRRRV